MDKRVKVFLKRVKRWKEEMELLREIVVECDLEEDFKWMHPCYTNNGNNIVLIHGFKEYCALLFHKGALLQDDKGVLIQQTKNTQVARQIRFTTIEEIQKLKNTIKAYIEEAIQNEKDGKEVELKKTSEYNTPEELLSAFRADAEFKKAFEKLTPGRQRRYILVFSQPKQSKTRKARIAKYTPQILNGMGLHDKYKSMKKK